MRWNLVKSIVKADLERRFGKPTLRHLKWIAIDEISIERGHRYLTVVLDLERGAVVIVGEGKGAEAETKDVLKGTRWLLLKNPDNLNEDKEEGARLQAALELNAPLAAAYLLKEDLRQSWEQPSKKAARGHLDGWIGRARATGIKQFKQMANTLSIHRKGLLACYDVPITTGHLEETHNKIQLFKRKSYGFGDREFFKLKIYSLHETRYQLIG